MRQDVPLAQASRLLNHGPTVLVSAAHGPQRNLMAAAWAMPLDFDPPKVAVVIDRATFTRQLIAASGELALMVPSGAQADLTVTVGNTSGQALAEADPPTDKFAAQGIGHFAAQRIAAPLVEGCLAWLECRVIAWPELSAAHDLYLAEVVAAQADARVFHGGRWHFDDAPPQLRSLHHLGGGQFVLPGASVQGERRA
ncbi:flavin reductase family protein [Aquabacterium sp. OR-4]|uniref:flavin reductase family protein n=1 Tax=Aquabacterium sp. OR-4 TaxID=2978127 RepID=UPI0021B2C4C0|nr:flavin reductase family protein [Aquabacterium sp. OR-4]MDT7836322.1 flavin reductase family protein [Aquabacterium sp. OR-4]